MTGRRLMLGGWLAIAAGLGLYTVSLDIELRAIHARLDQHGAALARLQLPPGFELDP